MQGLTNNFKIVQLSMTYKEQDIWISAYLQSMKIPTVENFSKNEKVPDDNLFKY